MGKITFTSPATASTAVGGAAVKVNYFEHVRIVAVLEGATGGTLDVYLQSTWDNGATWWDIVHFPQLADGAAQTTRTITLSRASTNTTLTAIGSGTSPALAAGAYLNGDFGEAIRAVAVAGSGTSEGKAQTIYILGDPSRAR